MYPQYFPLKERHNSRKSKQARSKRLQRRCAKGTQQTRVTKATNQLENSNDSLDTPLNESEEPQGHHSEEPHIISFH